MRFRLLRAPNYCVKVLLSIGMLSLGLVDAQSVEVSSRVRHALVTSTSIPNDPTHTLTAVVVELPPGVRSPSHHHAGTVFAYVLAGTVLSQLNGGKVMEYRAGQYWVEPPGTRHTLTENASKTESARILAMFVAPTGAQLTTYDK